MKAIEKTYRVHWRSRDGKNYPYVSIPKEWAVKHGLEQGDEVSVFIGDDLRITPKIGVPAGRWRTVAPEELDNNGNPYFSDIVFFRCPDCGSRNVCVWKDEAYALFCKDCGARIIISTEGNNLRKKIEDLERGIKEMLKEDDEVQ